MREAWGYRVCLVLCRSGDLVEGTYMYAWAKEHTSMAFTALYEVER